MATGVTGINRAKINDIEKNIDDYVQAIENAKITEISKQLSNTLEGEEKNIIKSTCQACDSYTNKLIKVLNDCKIKLEAEK